MPYFSRLTDIVTCNLSSILDRADDPAGALEEIIREMNEGAAGAERSVQAASNNVARIETEMGELRLSIHQWIQRATLALKANDEFAAREALQRKHEVEDLLAGLEQQLQAAISTRDHLRTMRNALQARMADAHRRLREIQAGGQSAGAATGALAGLPATPESVTRVDAELEALRQLLQEGKEAP